MFRDLSKIEFFRVILGDSKLILFIDLVSTNWYQSLSLAVAGEVKVSNQNVDKTML